MSDKPDVAVGELLRDITAWIDLKMDDDVDDAVRFWIEKGDNLLLRCRAAITALSALPAEPKHDAIERRIALEQSAAFDCSPGHEVAAAAEPKHQIAQRFNLMPLGMFPSDTGLWVRYNEHLAIVAALEKQLPIRPTPATQEQWLPGPGVPSD